MSQIADKFVDNALDFLKVGQEVKARVTDVDLERKRIALSLKTEGATTSNRTNTRSDKGQPNFQNKQQPKSKPLKNNAFASLKDFKLK